jgi:DNA-binding transcriptional regulator of glucitol operon
MLRRLRFALSPGWLVLHLITIAMVVAMVLLGRWQLDVSNAKHFSLQNFGYALQWWAFSLFALAMWARIMLDTRSRSTAGPLAGAEHHPSRSADAEPARPDDVVAYRRYVMPQSGVPRAPDADPERAAYNDYLARLDADSPANTGAEGTAS